MHDVSVGPSLADHCALKVMPPAQLRITQAWKERCPAPAYALLQAKA